MYSIRPSIIVWCVLACLVALFTVGLQSTITWRGDGMVKTSASGKPLRAAMIVTRRSYDFAIDAHYTYVVQQIDFPGGSYIRLHNCTLQGKASVRCLSTDGKFYQIRVMSAPSLQQVQDDDGVT